MALHQPVSPVWHSALGTCCLCEEEVFLVVSVGSSGCSNLCATPHCLISLTSKQLVKQRETKCKSHYVTPEKSSPKKKGLLNSASNHRLIKYFYLVFYQYLQYNLPRTVHTAVQYLLLYVIHKHRCQHKESTTVTIHRGSWVDWITALLMDTMRSLSTNTV